MDNEKELVKTSKDFQEFFPGIKVLDPDGWHRDDKFDYEWNEELITLEEYFQRVLHSTIQIIDHPNNLPFLYWVGRQGTYLQSISREQP